MTNKIKTLLTGIVVLAVVTGTVYFLRPESDPTRPAPVVSSTQSTPIASSPPNSQPVKRVPAYQSASEARNLPVTLPPERFVGKAKEAYIVARQIPATLAQLPCYCHCDQGFGHKSLQTCFVDDHAAHCAVCVDEALLAYRLQRAEKLTPEQVREKIVEKYSVDQHQH